MSLSAHVEPTAAWRELRAELRRAVGESTFEIWLAALELRSAHDSKLVVDAPAATYDWVSKRFGRLLESSARHVFGDDVEVEIATHGVRRASRPAPRHEALDLDASALNPRYSFDQFIIGDGNRLAHAAALAVAELPGQAYNPLFLHAPPGLGKTHLLHAIGNYVQAFGDGAGVRYTTAEAFTNQFITALGSRSVDRFKRAYRDADVLLIDDVQFLASKARTEEEFFHTFNAVYETGRQLVVTCDRLPRQLVSIEERLRERFESGLVAVIQPPDFATRVAILRKRAALDRIWIEDDAVLESIAARVTDNVRVLEGALIRIVAYNSLTQLPIDVELAQTVLNEIRPRPQTASLSIADIQRVVAGHYGLAVTDLVSSSRAARVSWPRQLAIHLARQLTSASLNAIGEAFGGRNHATVLHACKRVEERVGSDQHAVDELEELIAAITSSDTDRSH
ncbi:MAG TPA: chromosomal replication initiator protein DnaA [Solirubrobacteraceae bacterium]|nr:chromosomal replication initiator protein DnaA [Solirubrobacteraceae bacterium]